ncbi:MAG: prepilin-type N-terminal cleavage/methylation domain-containing protein [Pseudoalteromonas tetraodonis]|jgi:prepilin-type N-terminal cleavage/methylation domain-containing protein
MDNRTIDSEKAGFSLVEVLAAVAIIGVITFLALPNIITVRQDAEQNLSITRAEALNMATAAFIQSRGRSNAEAAWAAKGNDVGRYELLSPFLAFAPATLANYMPKFYHVKMKANFSPLEKVELWYDTDTSDDNAATGTGWEIEY